ncbi:MAG: hypothetical protein CM1200mP28_09380 [Deltaproteobacteria bacterium]|nr:MAG: hypothetical protein CM1200mP28_09380 [Deltaproteobacteria bacterium]
MALGYLHAQERLFQLELMIRVAQGRLSEILGEDMLTRTAISAPSVSARVFRKLMPKTTSTKILKMLKMIKSLSGRLNAFVSGGPHRLNSPFWESLKRIYHQGFNMHWFYMSYTFTNAVRQDPLLSHIHNTFGAGYLKDLAFTGPKDGTK